MSHLHPVWELLDKLQMDNRAMAAKLVELRAHVAALELPDQAPVFTCDTCKRNFRSRPQLEEHVYYHHDGPTPAHFLRAEERAA